MFKRFFDNTRKPRESFGGRFMLYGMNRGHEPLAQWGMKIATIRGDEDIADIGCGGGRNVSHLLERTTGKVYGVDYSEASCAYSRRYNEKAIDNGRCEIIQASVSKLPFKDESLGFATAFETVYFWPDLVNDFREVLRCLAPGGAFLIVNESSEDEKQKKWEKIIDGMRIYTRAELTAALTQAGFSVERCDISDNKRHVRILARKPRKTDR